MKHLVLFTMKGCSHCNDFKNMLSENDVLFYEHDIDEHKEEYDMFVEVTKSEFVPAFMIIEQMETGEVSSKCFVPDTNFDTLDEALEVVKKEVL